MSSRDLLSDRALRAVVGVGAVFGLVALIFLVTGSPGAFFGFAVMGAGFAGLGWAGLRLMGPPEEGWASVPTVVLVVFGGAGGLMLLGSLALLAQGELGGAAGLAVFGLVFGGVGYGGSRVFRAPEGTRRVLVSERRQTFEGRLGTTGRRTSRTWRYVDAHVTDAEIEHLQEEWAERPWTRRADWAEGRVVQQGPGSMRLLVGFTVAWNVVAWGIAGLALASEWGSGDVPWFVLVFPAIGLGLAVMTARTWARRRKFGIGVLHLDTVPARPGGSLRGMVETGVAAEDAPDDGFRLRLLCAQRRSWHDQDGDRRVSVEELWSDERRESGWADSGGRLFVSVDFEVPADQPPTELQPDDDRVLWRLEVSGPVPGVDYAAQFEVPVYLTLPPLPSAPR